MVTSSTEGDKSPYMENNRRMTADPRKEQNFSPGWRENWTKKKSVKTTKCLLAAGASHKGCCCTRHVTCDLSLVVVIVTCNGGERGWSWGMVTSWACCRLHPGSWRGQTMKERGSLWSRCLATNNWGTHLHRKDWLAREDNWQTNECLCLHYVYSHWIRTMKV